MRLLALALPAAAAAAQPPAPPTPPARPAPGADGRVEERIVRERVLRDASGRDSVVRDTVYRRGGDGPRFRDDFGPDGPGGDDVVIRRMGPGRAPGVWAFGGAPGTRVRTFTARAEPPRSALGVYLGEADTAGVRVERVSADGPAARAGVAAGDRIAAVNGVAVRVDRADAGEPLAGLLAQRRVERAIGRLAPNSEVELRLVRDGRERAVRARTVAPASVAGGDPTGFGFEMRGPDMGRFELGPARTRAFGDSARARSERRAVLGMTLGPSRAARDTLGLFVSAVAAEGPAARAGVVEGDRVAAINSVDLRVPREERDDPAAAEARRSRFTRELERARPGDRVTLRVYGDGRWRTVTATAARASEVYRDGAMGMIAPWAGDVMRFGPALAPGRMRMLAPAAPMRPMRPMRPLRSVAPLPAVPPRIWSPAALPLRRTRVVSI